ncbi:hypothetical protein VCHA53O466_40217 [Vibrio chagasii]|nr:hypothetical protein VCHA53O466_40217 [Vibrio chagasii]
MILYLEQVSALSLKQEKVHTSKILPLTGDNLADRSSKHLPPK